MLLQRKHDCKLIGLNNDIRYPLRYFTMVEEGSDVISNMIALELLFQFVLVIFLMVFPSLVISLNARNKASDCYSRYCHEKFKLQDEYGYRTQLAASLW